MIKRKVFLIPVGLLLIRGTLVAVKTWSRPPVSTAAPAQPPLQDPRFNFPAAPTTMTTEAHTRLAAESARYTVEAAMPERGTTRPPEEQKRLEDVAARLEKLAPVPDQRRAHFAWLEKPDTPVKFQSWGCLLQDAKPIDGGWNVRLIVMARGTGPAGQHIDIFNRYVEDYTLLENGDLRFLQGRPHLDDPGKPQYGRSGL